MFVIFSVTTAVNIFVWPAPMALAFRQPSVDIIDMCHYLSNQFMVNKILLLLLLDATCSCLRQNDAFTNDGCFQPLFHSFLSRVSMIMHAESDIVVVNQSVRPSVCHALILHRNECTYRQSLFTLR